MTQELEIQLSAEIIYVTGTVNNEPVTFTLAENNVWKTVVPKAEDDTYIISILAYDSFGRFTEYNETVFYGFAVITDRTEADVREVQRIRTKIQSDGWNGLSGAEQTYWLSNPKGVYGKSDLNRVGQSVKWLADHFNMYGYTVTVNTKTDWSEADVPRLAQMTTYLSNIQALIDAFYVLGTTPLLPTSMGLLGRVKANDIEKNILDMKTLFDNMIAGFVYSGETYSGEEDFN